MSITNKVTSQNQRGFEAVPLTGADLLKQKLAEPNVKVGVVKSALLAAGESEPRDVLTFKVGVSSAIRPQSFIWAECPVPGSFVMSEAEQVVMTLAEQATEALNLRFKDNVDGATVAKIAREKFREFNAQVKGLTFEELTNAAPIG